MVLKKCADRRGGRELSQAAVASTSYLYCNFCVMHGHLAERLVASEVSDYENTIPKYL
jgi:AhpD family alkylhydroperoxidase